MIYMGYDLYDLYILIKWYDLYILIESMEMKKDDLLF